MKYTLRDLMVLPLLFAGSLCFAAKTTFFLGHPRHTWVENKLAQIQSQLEMSEAFNEGPFPDDLINRWLSNSLTRDDYKNELVATLAERPQEVDPWGNHYRFVRRSGDPQSQYGVFSFGADAKSDSNGNDNDDPSTWSQSWQKHYAKRYRDRIAIITFIEAAFWTMIAYILLVLPIRAATISNRQTSEVPIHRPSVLRGRRT